MPEDKYKIIVEVVKDEFHKFNAEQKQALQKDVDDHKTANRLKVEDTKAHNAQIKAELKVLQSQLTASYQTELEAYKHGNQMKIKEAIATRKVLEGEIAGYTASLRGEIRKEVEEFKTGELQKRAELKKSITEMRTAPRVNLKGEIGSAAYVRQLQSAQSTMLPNTSEFTQTGLLIERYKANLNAAGVEVKSLAEKTSALNFENIKLAAGYLGIAAGGAQVISFVKESIAEWGKQEAALKSLNFAVTKVTGQNAQLTGSLVNYAQETQSVFKINDEIIEQQEAYLVLQGRSEEQIKQIIQASIDLAAAQGELNDETVIDNIKKLDGTYEGVVGRLAKYDGRLKDLTKSQLQNGDAVQILGEKYSGLGQEMLSGSLGASRSIGVLWNEVKELAGELFTHTGPALNAFTTGLGTLTRNLNEGEGGWTSFTEAMKSAAMELPLVGQEISGVIGLIQMLSGAQKDFQKAQLQITLPNIKNVAGQFNQFSSGNFTQDLQQISYWTGVSVDQLKELAKQQGLISDAKEIEANSSTITKDNQGAQTKQTKEQKEEQEKQLTILEAQRQELVLIQAKIILNADSELARKELLAEELKILERIGDLTGASIVKLPEGLAEEIQRLKNNLAPNRAGKPDSGAFIPSPQEQDDFISTMQEVLDLANQFGDALSGQLDEAGQKVVSIIQYLFSSVASILKEFGQSGEISPWSIFGSILGFLPFLLEDGGLLEGPPHSAGGIKIIAEGGEFMVKKEKVTPQVLPILEAYNNDIIGPRTFGNYFSAGGFIANQKRDSMFVGSGGGASSQAVNLTVELAGEMSELQWVNGIVKGSPGANIKIIKKSR